MLRFARRAGPPVAAAAAPAPREPGLRFRPRPVPPTAPVAYSADGELRVAMLVRADRATLDSLRAWGGVVGARVGGVATVHLPLPALDRLPRLAGLRYAEAARWIPLVDDDVADADAAARDRAIADAASDDDAAAAISGYVATAAAAPMLDLAADASGVERVRARSGDAFYGATGAGVLIGLFDSGVDLGHGDFRRADGSTRILRFWDQGQSGAGPGALGDDVFDYGVVCDSTAIDDGACAARDLVGHGTHVAGIAAGDGSATGNGRPPYRFVGVAPEARLLVVKGSDAGFTTADALDGVAYMMDVADALGLPLAVNLSIGSQQGPHDGTTLFEQALDSLAGPGRIVVAAAGNDGANRNESPQLQPVFLHARGTGDGDHALVVPPYSPGPDTVDDVVLLEMWYDAADTFTVSVTTPGGATVSAATGDSALVDSPDGTVFISNAASGPEAINGRNLCVIAVYDGDSSVPPAQGSYPIAIRAAAGNAGGYDLWVSGSSIFPAGGAVRLQGGTTNDYLVTMPGTATRVVAVAAWATRHSWRTTGNTVVTLPVGAPDGDLAFFSAPGPRVGGLLKPWIAAPGELVISARSPDGALWQGAPTLTEADGVHAALLGTSMATPFVTGAAALMLQLRPDLDPDDVRALLADSAFRDAYTQNSYADTGGDGAPNFSWGWGKLNAAGPVHALHPASGSVAIDVAAVAPGDAADSRAGARLPLLRLTATADSVEPVRLDRIAFSIDAPDPGAVAVLVLDEDGDGVIDDGERVEATADSLPASGTFAFDPGPVVPAGETRAWILALELSGAAPNNSLFRATLLQDQLVTLGLLSGSTDLGAAPPGATAVATTSVLEPDERVNLSSNPVRGDRLVINYAERPRGIRILTVAGHLVRRLSGADLEEGRAVWLLDNERGERVANGVYLLWLDLPGGGVARKVFVAR